LNIIYRSYLFNIIKKCGLCRKALFNRWISYLDTNVFYYPDKADKKAEINRKIKAEEARLVREEELKEMMRKVKPRRDSSSSSSSDSEEATNNGEKRSKSRSYRRKRSSSSSSQASADNSRRQKKRSRSRSRSKSRERHRDRR